MTTRRAWLRAAGVLEIASSRPALVVFTLVSLEALILIAFFGLAKWPISGGDGPYYHRLAVNILDHFAFSAADQPPYEPSVFRTPGYPLFVAVAYLVSGGSFLMVRVAQFLILGFTGLLLYKLSLKFTGRTVGLLAAVLCVTYPPFVFQAADHLTETLATFLAVLFVWFFCRAWEGSNPVRRNAFALGLVAGAGTMVRPSFGLLVLVPLAALLVSAWRRSHRSKAVAAVLVACGYVLCVGPWAVRNAFVSGEFVPLGASSGMSFFYSVKQYQNELSYRMTLEEWSSLIQDYDRRVEAASQQVVQEAGTDEAVLQTVAIELLTNRDYVRDGLQELGSLTAWQLMLNMPVRLACLWSPGDSSPWAAGTLFHRFVQAQIVMLSLLVLSGGYLLRAKPRSHCPLLIVPCYLTVVHLVFNAEPRYTFPARPFLLVFAAFALERIRSSIVERRRKLVLA